MKDFNPLLLYLSLSLSLFSINCCTKAGSSKKQNWDELIIKKLLHLHLPLIYPAPKPLTTFSSHHQLLL